MGTVTHKLQRAGTAVSGAGPACDLGRLRPVNKDPIFWLVSVYARGAGREIDRLRARLTQCLSRDRRPVILSCVFDRPSDRIFSEALKHDHCDGYRRKKENPEESEHCDHHGPEDFRRAWFLVISQLVPYYVGMEEGRLCPSSIL